jgi:hypothetical protein
LAKGGRIRLGVWRMPFSKFWWTAVKNAVHKAWHIGHTVHLVIVLLTGACVWVGIKFDEHLWIQIPFLSLIICFILGTLLSGHQIYLEECGKVNTLENNLKSLASEKEKEKADLQRRIDDAQASLADVREMLNKIAIRGRRLKDSPAFSYMHWFTLCKDCFVLAFGETTWEAFENDPAIQKEQVAQTIGVIFDCLIRHGNSATQDHLMSRCTKGELANINQRLEKL